MTRKGLVFFCLLFSCAGSSAANTASQVVRKALANLAPGQPVTDVGRAPMAGFYQGLVRGHMVYVSADGKYVMAGTLFATHKQKNLTEQHMAVIRRQALAKVPTSDHVVFAPAQPKYTVTVFTDLDCVYCRAFHRHIAAYNAEGIAVQYLFWPRSGLKAVPNGGDTPSYAKAVSVWCAADRKKAFTKAKEGAKIKPANCTNPVAREYHLGQHIGVDGTPTVIAEDGSVLGGYLDPQQLLQAVRTVHSRQHMRGAATESSSASQR